MNRILVITRSCWNNNNNIGNTMSSLFANFDDCEIYNLYLRNGKPDNNICKKTFRISEQGLIRAFCKHDEKCCEYVNCNSSNLKEETAEKNLYENIKKINLFTPWFVREFIWGFGKWKCNEFDKFILDVNPDLIFMPVFPCWYPHKILNYIKRKCDAKVVLYHADDVYSLKQFRFSPFFWLYRFRLRHWVKLSVANSNLNYAISYKLKDEYQFYFKRPFELLTKSALFENNNINKSNQHRGGIVKLLYTGNISYGRWKTISLIGKALDEINNPMVRMVLDLYTATPISRKMRRALSYSSIHIHNAVDAGTVKELQEESDVLLHVESFDLRDICEVRLSFSTKIIDYLQRGKPILVVGPKNVAAIEYFKKNEIGYSINRKQDIRKSLDSFLEKGEVEINNMANKLWIYGKEHHSPQNGKNFKETLIGLISGE